MKYWKLTKPQYNSINKDKAVFLWDSFHEEDATTFLMIKQNGSSIGQEVTEEEARDLINKWGVAKAKEMGLDNGICSTSS